MIDSSRKVHTIHCSSGAMLTFDNLSRIHCNYRYAQNENSMTACTQPSQCQRWAHHFMRNNLGVRSYQKTRRNDGDLSSYMLHKFIGSVSSRRI